MDKENFYLRKYNKYLDKTIIGIVLAVLLLAAALVFVWVYYYPHKQSKALRVNFVDDSNPATNDNKGVNVGYGSNLQSFSSDLGVTRGNDPLGNYQKAQLKQFCSQTDTSNAINLPTDFKYQQCDDGLKCTSGILKEGPICLADIGSNCNNLSDCVPGADACLQGKCAVIDVDNKINIPCDNDIDCQTNQFEDQFNNHICYKLPGARRGFCKVDLFPFDGGCRLDSDCIFIEGHEIKCVKNNNFNDTFFGASIISSRKFSEPYKGVSLTIKLDVNFNLNILNTSETNFMLNMIFPTDGIFNVLDPPRPYTIPENGVCILNNEIILFPLEFFSAGYPTSYDSITGVSVYFGDAQSSDNFAGRDKTTGGPYGICLDLLPVGSPANLKIGNITIPGLSSIPTTTADNRIISQSRIGIGNGKIGDFCFNKPNSDNILGCGVVKYLGSLWNLECGYNYKFEEIYLDNLYYNLRPDPFEIQYVGSCMIKNSIQFQPCNNTTLGCIDPNICLPILDPITNQQSNFCVAPMRSQICENNVCPTNYTCQGTSCLSNKGNLGITSSDCLSGQIANSTPILYVYNKDNQQYYNLNLDIGANINPGDNMTNLTFKMGTCYQTVDSYKSIGIENKSYLPKNLLVYGTPQSDGSIKGAVYQLNNNQYSYFNNFKFTPAANNTIHDISLVNDKIAVVQKRTIQELREVAFKVSDIINTGQGAVYIILEDNQYWYNFNMFIDNTSYDFYLFSPTDSSYNLKGTGTFNIANKFSLSSSINDYIKVDEGQIPGLGGLDDNTVYLIINTNSLAFNNNIYYTRKKRTGSNYILPFTEKDITVYIADNFDGQYEENLAIYGENFIMSPKVYSNNNTILNPDFQLNASQLQNGDRLKITDYFNIINYGEMTDDDTGKSSIGICGGNYLYTELVQPNIYYNSDVNNYVELNNFICNLHNNFISSQGNAPNLLTSSEGVYNQNLGVNIENEEAGIRFKVYDDMVNYNINFIPLEQGANNYTINNSNTFIGVSSSNIGQLYITNGINNSFSFNFENDTDIDFSFDENNNILIASQVEGVSGFYTYLQKVNYQYETKTITDPITNPDYKNFNLESETYYDKFYQTSYNKQNTNYLTNIKFKYLNQVVVPKAKSLYFDTSTKAKLVNKVEENSLDSGDNNISLFTTFRNDSFIEEDGNVAQRILDIDSQNIYSNKAPPIAAYSRLNDFNITTEDDEINFNYQGFENQNYNYVLLDNGISLNYTLDNNCVNDDTRFITFRDPEIIEVFLNNPASEIVLQKKGSDIGSFNIKKLKEGASISSLQVKDINNKSIYKSGQFSGDDNIDNYQISYNTENIKDIFSNTFNEINRTAVAIKEYNIYVDKNNDIKEFLVVQLNAGISIGNNYIQDCFNSDSQWFLWHNNIVEISYYPDLNYYFYTDNQSNLHISNYDNIGEQNLIVILDGSPLWTSTKNNENLPTGFSASSYNKLVVNDGSQFDIFNVHDNYYYRKNFNIPGGPGNDNNINNLIVNPVDGTINSQNTDYQPITLNNTSDFQNFKNTVALELVYNITTFAATVVSAPGLDYDYVAPNQITSDLSSLFYSQSGTSTILNDDQNISNDKIISFIPIPQNLDPTIISNKPITWNLPFLYDNQNPVPTNKLENTIYFNKSLPKKIKIFDVINTQVNRIFMPFSTATGSTTYFIDVPLINFPNNSFVCFKKKYVTPLPYLSLDSYNTDSDTYFKSSNTNILKLIGNNNSDYAYSINDYQDFLESNDSDNVYPAGITCQSISHNGKAPWKPTTRKDPPGDGGNKVIDDISLLLNYKTRDQGSGDDPHKILLFLSYDQQATIPSPLSNTDHPEPDKSKPSKIFSSSRQGSNPGTWTYSLSPFTKLFSYDPGKSFVVNFANLGSDLKKTECDGDGLQPTQYQATGIGIEAIFGGYDTPEYNYDCATKIFNFKFKNDGQTYEINFSFDLSSQFPDSDKDKNILSVANTRTKSDSFKKEIVSYLNTFKPLVYANIYRPNQTEYDYIYGLNYVVDGSFDMTFLSNFYNNTSTKYNVCGDFDIRPLYSSSINLPDNFQKYSKKLYMINNLFLSSLTTDFNYINLKLRENFFISNKVYIQLGEGNLETTYKGLGNIPFKLTSSPVITQNQQGANDFNLINYQEIRFPEWFTERYISRFNSIPKIKSIFISIKQGNIFNNMVYYPYLSYSTIEDSDTARENDQLLYMTTDVDQKTVLENRGVPYTMSLSLEKISVEQLERLVKFEPYNKFIFTLGYACL